MSRTRTVLKRTAVSFYDDQMTHHAAALTYYALMSLFPALLLGVSLLGLLGQYPDTYNGVISYLRDVVPPDTLNAVDHSVKRAFQHKGNASAALAVAVVTAPETSRPGGKPNADRPQSRRCGGCSSAPGCRSTTTR